MNIISCRGRETSWVFCRVKELDHPREKSVVSNKDVMESLGINVKKKFMLQSDIRRIVGETKKNTYEM